MLPKERNCADAKPHRDCLRPQQSWMYLEIHRSTAVLCWRWEGLIERVVRAANIPNWDENKRGQELASVLRGRAQAWQSGNFQGQSRELGKKLIHLLTLLNRNTAKTICANLQEQIQKPRESVFQTFKRFMASKPDEIRQSRIRTSAGKCGPAPRRPLGPTFKLVFTTGLCSDIRR